MASLSGKTIAITGAASGIGLATAKLLAHRGARLALADLQQDRLTALAKELSDSGADVLSTVVDVRDRSQVEDWMARTTEHFGGPVDGAANLAGIMGRSIGLDAGAVRNLADDEFDQVMHINCKGLLNCLRAQLNVIKEGSCGKGGGSIVNASSLAGLIGFVQNAAYCASKHAVIGMTKCAAKEEGPKGVRVNAIAPGIIDTPMMDHIDHNIGQRFPDPGPMGRRGTPEEAAELVCFLLGDESSFVTGAVYTVDGGWNC